MVRAAHTAKDVIKGKGKRGRKRKSATLEPEVARTAKEAIKGRGKRGRKHKIATQEAEKPEPEMARIINAPVPWRAPVTRII